MVMNSQRTVKKKKKNPHLNKRVNEETDSRCVEEEEDNLRRKIKREQSGERDAEEGRRKRRREDEQTVSFMYWLSVSLGFCNVLHRPTSQGRCLAAWPAVFIVSVFLHCTRSFIFERPLDYY